MTPALPPIALAAARRLVERRLGLRLAAHQDVNLAAALDELLGRSPRLDLDGLLKNLESEGADGHDWQRVVARVTVGETSFFRHREWIDAIETKVLAPLAAARRAEGRRSLAVWSVGCATGEEPYTLAIILRKLLPDSVDWNIRIRASDVNAGALAHARRGVYRDWSMREIDHATRERHFTRRHDRSFQLHMDIRDMVQFDQINLADTGWASGASDSFDLILCRNVLMYFPVESQRRIALELAEALAPGGWIAVSPAEASAELFRPLQVVNLPAAILFRRHVEGQPVRVTHPPVRRLPVAARPTSPLPPVGPVPSVPESPRPTLLDTARRLADAGRHREAQAKCEELLAAEPLSHDGYMLLAAIRAEADEFEAAIQAARQSVYLRPHCPDAAFLLAGLLMRLGREAAAARLMRRILDDLDALPDTEIVRPMDGMTARGMRDLVRSCLAAIRPDEDEGDGEAFPPPL